MDLITLILGGVLAAIVGMAGMAGAWLRGRSTGRADADQKHARETLERANTNAQERQHVEDDINRAGSDTAGQLRDKWARRD